MSDITRNELPYNLFVFKVYKREKEVAEPYNIHIWQPGNE